MSSLNIKPKINSISNAQKLIHLTLSNMLWENQFYEDGQHTAESIKDLVPKVHPDFVATLAKEARSAYKLRHVPLLLMRELARAGKMKAEDLSAVIQRPDEMSEFLSIYWKDGKTALSNQVKKGLASAFVKFNEYSLAKWDKNSAAVSLRDVMFLTHPKPADKEQELLFKKVANQELETPDTWETQLSAGADKKETFTRLMKEKKLGALAFLRNLRNMRNAGVDYFDIQKYASELDYEKILPFRFIAAARQVPEYSPMLEAIMLKVASQLSKIPGKTVLLVDVSGSMFGTKISAKSDLDRFDAAAALAVLCREICEEVEIYTFSDRLAHVNRPGRGMVLIEELRNSQSHQSTLLGAAVSVLSDFGTRTIVFTDEMTHDQVPKPKSKGYIINVAAYGKTGVVHSDWVRINGFSEAVLDYIKVYENHDQMCSSWLS